MKCLFYVLYRRCTNGTAKISETCAAKTRRQVMAKVAEQKARLTYDNILRMSDDPDVTDAIRFLRAREIVHFQRFGEALRLVKDRLDEKNVYYMNPSFDQ